MNSRKGRNRAGHNRRELVTLAAAVPLARLRKAEAKAGRFFAPAQLATLDVLAEQIVPADEHSPGAREAKVAETVDAMLAELEPRYPEHRKRITQWRDGIAGLERDGRQRFGKPYAELGFDEQRAILASWANAPGAEDPRRVFFAELKSRVTFAYYTSSIGIHQEIGYLGNTYSSDFEGEDAGPPLAQVFAQLKVEME